MNTNELYKMAKEILILTNDGQELLPREMYIVTCAFNGCLAESLGKQFVEIYNDIIKIKRPLPA